MRLVLLGDSILDNRPYTEPEPDTTAHLQRLLGNGWIVERFARDGAVMADVPHQVRAMAESPDVAVLSIGGNDAIEHIGLLERHVTSAAVVFDELLQVADDFEARYEQAARAVAAVARRTVLCAIYNVRLQPAKYSRLVRVPIAVLNDRILAVAARIGTDVLDLRTVCTDDADFVLQIEPSAAGAEKIARAIAKMVEGGSS